ncbi:MAG TPA: SRPBCC family protein [Longimicrobium sp.]
MTTPTARRNRHGSAVITLPSDTDYLVTRQFDAPARLVFRAFTTPELVRRWWGFETSEWLVCEIDLRVGGRWRFVVREQGMEVGFNGEYREIAPPHRLVNTEMYEGVPDPKPEDYAVNTMTLEEADGVTTMKVLVHHSSREVRDMVLATGMESGMQVSYDRLEDLVREDAGAPAAAAAG